MTAQKITVNGLDYVRKPSQAVVALFTGPRTPAGMFKPRGNGVLLMRLSGEPFAFVSGNDGGFIVNASKQADGRVRFMHGTDARTDAALGITGYMHGRETARAFLEAAR